MRNSGIEVLFEGRNFLRLLEGLWVTASIALAAMAISVVLGVLLGIVMTSRHRFVRACTLASQAGVNLGGRTAAVIVFSVWGTAEMGDLVRGAIRSTPSHQVYSGLALGMTSAQVYRYVVLPQTIRRLLPVTINLANRMIQTTTLVVLIGVVEVLKTGQQIIDANRFAHPTAALWVYAVIFLMYFAICYLISLLSKRLERKWQS